MPLTTPDIERRWKNLPGEPVGDAGDPYTGYDRFGRTERMRWVKPIEGGYESLMDVQWGYNQASLKTWRKDLLAPASTSQDQHFGYDGLYQVTERQRGLLNINTTAVGGIPAQVENFSYDETGNWVSYRQSNSGELDIEESRVNNRSNQMAQVDGSSAGVKYDKNGNMLLVPTGDGLTGPSRKLVWDAWNRLRKVSDDSDTVIAEYEYDGNTRRTVKHAEGTTRRYYYNDQWRSVEERINGETPAESQFVWDPVNRWEMLFRDRGGERHYPLKDQLDVVALCDSTGTVQERYDYTAFGSTSVLNADFTPKEGPTITWDFLFHAEFKDHESEWYNYGYRYYLPTLGRWLSRDPIGEQGGLNLYGMVANNAVNWVDSYGLIRVTKDRKGNCQGRIYAGHGSTGAGKDKKKQMAREKKKPGCTPPTFYISCKANDHNKDAQSGGWGMDNPPQNNFKVPSGKWPPTFNDGKTNPNAPDHGPAWPDYKDNDYVFMEDVAGRIDQGIEEFKKELCSCGECTSYSIQIDCQALTKPEKASLDRSSYHDSCGKTITGECTK